MAILSTGSLDDTAVYVDKTDFMDDARAVRILGVHWRLYLSIGEARYVRNRLNFILNSYDETPREREKQDEHDTESASGKEGMAGSAPEHDRS